MFTRSKRFIAVGATALMVLLCAAPAMAGGTGKECGRTPVDGSYKKYCTKHYWTTSNKYYMECREISVPQARATCDQVKQCDFKITFDAYGKIVCD